MTEMRVRVPGSSLGGEVADLGPLNISLYQLVVGNRGRRMTEALARSLGNVVNGINK